MLSWANLAGALPDYDIACTETNAFAHLFTSRGDGEYPNFIKRWRVPLKKDTNRWIIQNKKGLKLHDNIAEFT